jgi:outer membrane protein, heavy metal efflux system
MDTIRRRCLALMGLGLLTGLPLTAAAGQDILPTDTTSAGRIWAAVRLSNLDLVAAQRRVEAAQARARSLGFAPPAALSAQVEDVQAFDMGTATTRVQFEREVLIGGRGRAARTLGATEVDLAQAGLEITERRLLGRTMRALAALYGWTRIGERLGAEDSLLAAAELSLRDRFAVGDARYVDVLRVRAERLRVQTDVAAAVAEAQGARDNLTALAGGATRPAAVAFAALLDSALVGSPPFQTVVAPSPPMDSLLALSGRVHFRDAAVGHARAAREVVLAEQRPRLALGLGAQVFTDADVRRVGPTLGVSLGLPFTAHRPNTARAAAAERDVAATEAEQQAALLTVRADLAIAAARYAAARERLAIFDRMLLVGAREERETALAAYRNGELSLIELLDFERALARAETDQWRARMVAIAALADLLSGGNPGPDSERLGSGILEEPRDP